MKGVLLAPGWIDLWSGNYYPLYLWIGKAQHLPFTGTVPAYYQWEEIGHWLSGGWVAQHLATYVEKLQFLLSSFLQTELWQHCIWFNWAWKSDVTLTYWLIGGKVWYKTWRSFSDSISCYIVLIQNWWKSFIGWSRRKERLELQEKALGCPISTCRKWLLNN